MHYMFFFSFSAYRDEPPDEREGTTEDAKVMEALFEDLGFKVAVHTDKTYSVIEEIIIKCEHATKCDQLVTELF